MTAQNQQALAAPAESLSQVTHLIFDCDGVLIDSEVIAIEVEAELLSEAGISVTADEIADRFVGLTYTNMLEQLEVEFERTISRELVHTIERRVLEAFPSRLQPVRGMEAFLHSSQLPRCVASSSDLDRVQDTLAMTGLASCFQPDRLYSAQMVDRGKPESDLFLLAADRFGVPPAACLVVEDSPHGVTAAVRAGMPVIGLVAGRHARPALADRLRAAGANHIAECATELQALLGSSVR